MITVVLGPPCGGKSSHVRESKKDGDVVVDFDEIARALGASGHRPDGAVKDAAFAARRAVVDLILSGIDADSWVIHTSPTADQRSAYEESGATFVTIDPGMDVCLERAAVDGRPEGTEETIRQWYAAAQDETKSARGGRMKIKSLPIGQVKAGPEDGLDEGQFLVYPSTFIRKPDSYGDVVAKGAFVKTIEEWKDSGNVLPGLYGHRMDDPDFFVAGASEMGEDEHGWWVKGEFDLESPKGRQVYRLVKGRRLNQLSFAYDVREEARVELEDGQKANELRDLKVYEFSFVPVGANQDTSVVAIKALADGMKAGRVLSAKNERSLREARDAIDSVLSSLGEDEDEEKAAPAADQETPSEHTEEPTQSAKGRSTTSWEAALSVVLLSD